MALEATWFDSKIKAQAFLNGVFSGPVDESTFSHFEYDDGRTAAVMVNLAADDDYRIDDYSQCSALPQEIRELVHQSTAVRA